MYRLVAPNYSETRACSKLLGRNLLLILDVAGKLEFKRMTRVREMLLHKLQKVTIYSDRKSVV